MKKYVLGFAFDSGKNHVVLIRKEKPDWQKGFFNGVGGKIEPTETAHDAMVREFMEETGVGTDKSHWQMFAVMKGEGWECACFSMASDISMKATTKETEQVSIFHLADIIYPHCITNLTWLIPMAMREEKTFAEIKY